MARLGLSKDDIVAPGMASMCWASFHSAQPTAEYLLCKFWDDEVGWGINMKATAKKVIVGLGKTGLSCAHYLARNDIPFAITDNRESPPGLADFKASFPEVPLVIGKFDPELISQADEIIISPGVSLQEPIIAEQVAKGKAVVGDVELFARVAKVPIVAITGSNGKSTVTLLLAEMAKQAGINAHIGGNFGIPVLDLLEEENVELYVLELSSFQLETTQSLQAAAAVVLNISPDHMDRYTSIAEYVQAKQRIYHSCNKVVVNRDEPQNYIHATKAPLSFGLSEPEAGEFGIRQTRTQVYLAFGNELLISEHDLQIKGQHNWANVLAAFALGHAIDLPMTAMLDAVRAFKGLAHRCQKVANLNDVDWYDDSKGTNVGSTLAAIEGLGNVTLGKIVLIAGGIGKGADFLPLVPVVDKYVKSVILFGRDAKLIGEVLTGAAQIIYAKDLPEAVLLAKEQARAKDTVLLSPACASFDMFDGYAHRGEVFVESVRGLR